MGDGINFACVQKIASMCQIINLRLNICTGIVRKFSTPNNQNIILKLYEPLRTIVIDDYVKQEPIGDEVVRLNTIPPLPLNGNFAFAGPDHY